MSARTIGEAASAAVEAPGCLVSAIEALGTFAAELEWEDVPDSVRDGARRVVRDSVAVLVAGGRLDEQAQLRKALPVSGGGTASVMGADELYGITDAAWLNGNALVALELDEGNKRVRGHASAHVLPAVLAVAEHRHASGREFAAAFVAGHEVASRFGRATMLKQGVHPHGNWGVAGAAAGVARAQGADAATACRAIDAAGALALATPFQVATGGLSVRNAWVGAANVAGIYAAALAAQPQPVLGVAGTALGELLGTLDVTALVTELGVSFSMTCGYFKRHASCSYTHPPADAVLELFGERGPVTVEEISSIEVRTHQMAAQLDGTTWATRLAAMFSIPYVVAVTMREGVCGPGQFDKGHREDPALASLAARIRVVEDADLTAQLPARRVARVTVTWADGSRWQREVENPVGDADYLPFSDEELFTKAAMLLGGDGPAAEVRGLCDELLETDDVHRPLAELRRLACRAQDVTPNVEHSVHL